LILRRIFLVWLAVALMAHPGAAAGQDSEPPKTKLIVLDPGHGGVDLGVRSSKSTLEKSVTMKLAMAIAALSAKYPGLSVAMTREGDLDRAWLRRLEFANSKKADLFLSLHTGGGFTAKTRPIEIFIPSNSQKREDSGGWDSLNLPFKAANLRLAKLISSHMAAAAPEKEIKIIPSGRLMLEGLAMPAVIIEPWDLSNPQDEIKLEEKASVEKMASSIMLGIASFMGVKEQQEIRDE